MLDALITSKTRLKLLVKFFINTANEGHLRGLASDFKESTNAIRKELNNLSEAGFLEKENVGNRIQYKANTKHPLFGSLQQIVRKYIGLDTIVEQVLKRLGNVRQIVLMGDYASGLDTGTIVLTIVGEQLNEAYVNNITPKLEQLIGRKVSFILSGEEVREGLIIFEDLQK